MTLLLRSTTAALAVLLLAACMPQQPDDDRDRTFTVAKAIAPLSLDPAVYATGNDYPIQELIYHQLVALDASKIDGVSGELATSWETDDGGLSIVFDLRRDLTFESGAAVDAEAVRYSLERVKRLGRWSSAYLDWMDSVEVLEPYRVKISMKRPYRPALQILAQSAASIVDPSIVRPNEGADFGSSYLSTHSAGSGPYKLADISLDGTVTVELRPTFGGQAYFQKVQWRVIPDEGVRRLLLERGDIDFTDIVPAAFLDRYASLSGVDVKVGQPGASLSYITLNNRGGVFSDLRLRQAVYNAIDYAALRTRVLRDNVAQLPGFIPPQAPGFDQKEPMPRRDLMRAKALLNEAGYSGETITFLTSQVGPVGEFLQSNLREAGMNIRIVRRDPASIEALKRNGEFDLIYEGWLMDTADPATLFEALFHSRNISSGLNASGYSDPILDQLIEQLLRDSDYASRLETIRAIDSRLRAERPIVMIFAAQPIAAFRDEITGIEIDPLKPFLQHVDRLSRIGSK